jgi:hypothetical protein
MKTREIKGREEILSPYISTRRTTNFCRPEQEKQQLLSHTLSSSPCQEIETLSLYEEIRRKYQ